LVYVYSILTLLVGTQGIKEHVYQRKWLWLGLWCPNLLFESSEKSNDYCQNSEVNEEGAKEKCKLYDGLSMGF